MGESSPASCTSHIGDDEIKSRLRAIEPPVSRLLGRNIISASAIGTVEILFEAKSDFMNGRGTIQGGMLSAMLDTAMGNAVAATLAESQSLVTLEFSVRFLRPALPGSLRSKARVTGKGRRIRHVEAELYDEARILIARSASIKLILSKDG